MMKILQINNFHNRRGGADSVYLNTIGLLRKKGHTVVEFAQAAPMNEPSEYESYFVEGFDPLKLPFYQKILKTPRQLYSFESRRKLDDLLRATAPDVAHIHLYKGVLTASILSALRKNHVPTVITLHDFSLLCPRNILFNADNEICERCIGSTSLNCLVHRCNRKNVFYSAVNVVEFNLNNHYFKPRQSFDKIITVSLFSYGKHITQKHLQDRLVHLYNFFPGLTGTPPAYRRGNYYLFFGRLSPEKGLHTLIRAFAALGPDHRLIIAGTGPLEAELRETVQKNRYDHIEMVGYRGGEELNDLIRNASFILVPSEWYENNPMTVVEGYSLGKPVIGSSVGGIPELIPDGQTGFQFAMADVAQLTEAVRKASLLSDDAYIRMSENAWHFAREHFGEETHYDKLMEIYRSTLQNQPSA